MGGKPAPFSSSGLQLWLPEQQSHPSLRNYSTQDLVQIAWPWETELAVCSTKPVQGWWHTTRSALQPQAWMQNYSLTSRAQRILHQVVTMVIACREALIILTLRRLRACEEAIQPISKAKASGAWIILGFTLWLSLPQRGGSTKYVESHFFSQRVRLWVLLTHRFHSLSSCPRTSGTYSSHTGLQIDAGQGIFQTYKVHMAEVSMAKGDSVVLDEV